ncbi:MAG: acyl carrier protein [Bacteriovoracaceae bacterium]
MQVSESNVKKVIENYLNAEITDAQIDFFELGILDSFDAVNILLTLEKAFQVKLEVLDFADNSRFTLNYVVENVKRRKA